MSRSFVITCVLLAAIVGLAVAAPLLPIDEPTRMNLGGRLAGPSWEHWLGQDQYGRDVLSRMIWGARTSLTVAAISSLLACVIGTAIGIVGGFLRGIPETIAMRGIDVLLCFPPLLLALLVVTLSGPGTATLIPVLALVYIPSFARVAHAGVLTVRSQDYVEAVRSLGAKPARIMLRTVLPNIAGPVVIQLSLTMAAAIVLESGLSFLGLGVVPPMPSWGLMIAEARGTLSQSWLLVVWPCLVLTLTIYLLNVFCDQLRDLLDPQSRTAMQGRRNILNLIVPGVAPKQKVALRIDGFSAALCKGDEALRDVTLTIRAGETLALVGESGSGKSLTSLAVMRLLPDAIVPTRGSIWFEGQDLLRLDETQLCALRGKRISMIFQDPASSLNPVYRIGDQIAETLRVHGHPEPDAAALDLLRRVGIPDPERRSQAFPHELSGGMRQRVVIAIAIANNPSLIIADEPTTALDVTIQAQILDLLADLKAETGASMLFVSHSLPVVSEIADRVAIMYCGEIVEEGPARAVLDSPRHPYTQALIENIPEEGRKASGIPGVVPALADRPKGCGFAPRCSFRRPACEAAHPKLEANGEHFTRCIRWRELCKAA